MKCQICENECAGPEVLPIGDEGAEFFNCLPEEFVCFWCVIGVNWDPRTEPFPWPFYGKA